MKKVFLSVILLAFVISCVGLACAETVNGSQLLGTISGDTYINEYFSIGCKFEDWTYLTEKEIANLNHLGEALGLPEETLKYLDEASNAIVMMVQSASGLENANFTITNVEPFLSFFELFGFEGYLDAIKETNKSMYEQAGFQNVVIERITVQIDDKYYPGYDISCEYMGNKNYLKQIYILNGKYMATISVTTALENSTDEVFSHFFNQ